MNVIKVRRPRGRRNNTQIHSKGTTKSRMPNDFEWHGLAEAFLFGVITFISIWPVFDAMAAVIRLKWPHQTSTRGRKAALP